MSAAAREPQAKENADSSSRLLVGMTTNRVFQQTAKRGGAADEWVTQLLRQGDSQVFKRYSQMKLQMKREALEKINRQANEMLLNPSLDSGTVIVQ